MHADEENKGFQDLGLSVNTYSTVHNEQSLASISLFQTFRVEVPYVTLDAWELTV